MTRNVNENLPDFENVFHKDTFVLKGKWEKPESEFLEFYISDLFAPQQTLIVMLQEDGSFEESFEIVGGQNIFFRHHIAYNLQVRARDTITICQSSESPEYLTFKQKGVQEFRDVEFLINRYSADHFGGLQQKLFSKNPLDDPQNAAEDYLQELLLTITSSQRFSLGDARIKQLIDDQYYWISSLLTTSLERPATLLYPDTLLDELSITTINPDIHPKTFVFKHRENKKLTLLEDDFMLSEKYRLYLRNLIDYGMRLSESDSKYKPLQSGQHLQILYRILGEYGSSSLISESLMYSYLLDRAKYYDPKHVEESLNFAAANINSTNLSQKLRDFRDFYTKFGKGMPAPDFEFEDRHGNPVSLASLTGRVVYLDFWGVYCGPCIEENEKYAPLLYDAYANDNIVFVNVCFDVEREKWKANIKEERANVIELYAPRKMNNEFIKSYQISGIPHYFIIDQHGKIFNNNAPRPSMLVSNARSNELRRVLRAN